MAHQDAAVLLARDPALDLRARPGDPPARPAVRARCRDAHVAGGLNGVQPGPARLAKPGGCAMPAPPHGGELERAATDRDRGPDQALRQLHRRRQRLLHRRAAARCWGSSARTAPANPPPCACWPGFMIPTAGTARIAGPRRPDRRRRRPPRAGLPARGRADLSRDDGRRLPAISAPGCAAISGAELADRVDHALGLTTLRRRAAAAGGDVVERLQAPRRAGAGAAARSAGAGAGRADRRPRPQPEARGARPDRADGAATRRSSSRPISWRRSMRCARAPSSSPAAASSPTRRPRSCSGASVRQAGGSVPRNADACDGGRLMRNVLIIAGRELRAYFATPVADRVHRHLPGAAGRADLQPRRFFDRGQADLNPFFTFIPWVFLLLVPPSPCGCGPRNAGSARSSCC